ncbi:hypothetical protein D3C85_1715700 [compost metagenome]
MRFDVYAPVIFHDVEWIRLKVIPIGLRLFWRLATQINLFLHSASGPDDHLGICPITAVLILEAQPVLRLCQLR